jgi:hypothetical protein
MLPTCRVIWPEWIGIVVICTISGALLGTAAYWEFHAPRLPSLYLVVVVLAAVVVAFAFALIASVLAAILLIIVAKHGPPSPTTLRLSVTGALAGALLGALHPVIVVLAIVRALSSDPNTGSVVSLGALVAVSGAISGAVVLPRYVPRLRGRMV